MVHFRFCLKTAAMATASQESRNRFVKIDIWDMQIRKLKNVNFSPFPFHLCHEPGDLVMSFGGLGRKILTLYPTTVRGLRCCF